MRNSTFELFQLVNWWCLTQVPILASCPIISLDVEFQNLVAKQSWKMPKGKRLQAFGKRSARVECKGLNNDQVVTEDDFIVASVQSLLIS